MEQVSIERLQFHEPKEGYWLAFSGGKDSTVIYDLAVRSGVRFEAHYNVTGIDPPELVRHIREHYPTVIRDMPEKSIWQLVETHGLPTRTRRWCCEDLKERSAAGRTVVIGIRWAESTQRKSRPLYAACYKDRTKHYLSPIIDWNTEQVWAHIRQHNLPYCKLYDEGFDRLGCVLCPMLSVGKTARDVTRWPKLGEAWKRAAYRVYETRTPEQQQKYGSAEAFWQWWISRKAQDKETSQMVLFE